MPDRDSISNQIIQALREHGLAAAIGVWFSLIAGLAAAVTRKAFTNERCCTNSSRSSSPSACASRSAATRTAASITTGSNASSATSTTCAT